MPPLTQGRNDMLTLEEFEKMSKAQQASELTSAVAEAQEDDTPYVGIVDDELHVIGDPDKTEVKKHDYIVHFTFPNTREWRDALKSSGDTIESEQGDYVSVKREFKGVYVRPKQAKRTLEAFARLQIFLMSVGKLENGEYTVNVKTEDEARAMFESLDEACVNSMYDAVSAFLGISAEEGEFMRLDSAMFTLIKIIRDNPDILNGGNLFFG